MTLTLEHAAALNVEELSCLFKALADPMRLRIVQHLTSSCCAGLVCACDLEELTGLTQPTVSHHMKCLISAGLVVAQKEGRWVNYTLAGATLEKAIRALGALQ